ncbi:MAG: N-acetylglucosamine-6-phosphate deacetylase [Ruminococcus sp.]|nr:N-acetylglucosamine-6-phosphate deacetylase [Ruminococcus sp.]
MLKNGLVFTPDRVFERLDLSFDNGIITGTEKDIRRPGNIIDCRGKYVIPGLTDVHLHGCGGADVCDGTQLALETVCRSELSHGVTTVCPATMTLPDERLKKVLRCAADFAGSRRKSNGDMSEIVGLHLEGPFISREKCGAQDGRYVQFPSAGKLREYQNCAGGLIKLVTIAPELDGAVKMIKELSGQLHFSLGHTSTDHENATAAFCAGADHVTHLFNAMPPLHHRGPGLIGAAADTEECFAELICDGVHVSPSAVRAAFKLFPGRIVLISDSMEAAGMADGEYMLGGQKVYKTGAKAVLKDGTLAGSVSTLYDCMVNAVRMGISLEDAISSATIVPCRSIGIDKCFGSLEVGKRADILITDMDLRLERVIKS